jgi:hypothetical protein
MFCNGEHLTNALCLRWRVVQRGLQKGAMSIAQFEEPQDASAAYGCDKSRSIAC